MAYTVKKFSELGNVTVRTLHFYEEVGILLPSYYGENGYRYYEDKELLILEEIALLKELGFSIGEIQKFFSQKKQSPVHALQEQKQTLLYKLEKLQKTLRAIDLTIDHLKEENMMKNELFKGVDIVKKTEGNSPYKEAEEVVLSSCISSVMSPSEKLKLQRESKKTLQELARLMKKGNSPAEKDVQKELSKYLTLISKCHKLNQKVCFAFSVLYQTHPIWIKQLQEIEEDLPKFLASAVEHFAKKNF